MGRFDDLHDIKSNIMSKLYSCEDIVKCLLYNKDTDVDFLKKNIPVGYDASSLIYTQIFPYYFVPKIETDANIYITMKFRYKPCKTKYKIGSICFYVTSHQSLMQSDEGLRTDFIIRKIDEIFNCSRGIGLGQLEFDDMSDFMVDSSGQWIGSYIAYKSTEFQ